MKKILSILIVAVAMLVATPAKAEIKWGIRGGANITNFNLSKGLGNLDKDNRAGFFVGPTMLIKVPVVGMAVDASALYDSKTVRFSNGENSTDVTSHSIAIPVNLRYGFSIGKIVNLFGFAGPQVSFNLAKDKNLFKNIDSWKWSTSNFSINVGVGCVFFSHLELKANYNIGCTQTGEVFDSNGQSLGIKGSANAWQLGLAYWF